MLENLFWMQWRDAVFLLNCQSESAASFVWLLFLFSALLSQHRPILL